MFICLDARVFMFVRACVRACVIDHYVACKPADKEIGCGKMSFIVDTHFQVMLKSDR